MIYEEWIRNIDELSKKNDKNILLLMQQEDKNEYICDMLEPKLENLVYFKIRKMVSKLSSEISNMFMDHNYLDLMLVNYNKDKKFILGICEIKQMSSDVRDKLIKKVNDETERVFEMLIREANKVDMSGVLGMTIKNNMIRGDK